MTWNFFWNSHSLILRKIWFCKKLSEGKFKIYFPFFSKLSLYYIRSILVFSTNFFFKSHLKWLFFVVNISHMPLKIWTDWKRSFAIFAFVRLFPCVSSKMACKIGRSGKHFPAKSTTVFLLWAITMIRYWLH